MKIVYSTRYNIDLGAHVWPTQKYGLIAAELVRSTVVREEFVSPEPCAWEDLALVHTPEYLEKVRTLSFSPSELATLELPLTHEIAEGFRLMVGGTCRTAALALQDGLAVHLGGGFHHAFANHGEGFCLFNDVAVAIRRLQRDRSIRRAAVIDCDVHHGNGTAMIFGTDDSVFTLSIHQEHNYPAFKPKGDLDIGLADGTRDDDYLARLGPALDQTFDSRPDLAFYVAGADPFEGDRLGGLRLTGAGLARRDRAVFSAALRAEVPIAVVLAGGYASNVADTVGIHVATVSAALETY